MKRLSLILNGLFQLSNWKLTSAEKDAIVSILVSLILDVYYVDMDEHNSSTLFEDYRQLIWSSKGGSCKTLFIHDVYWHMHKVKVSDLGFLLMDSSGGQAGEYLINIYPANTAKTIFRISLMELKISPMGDETFQVLAEVMAGRDRQVLR